LKVFLTLLFFSSVAWGQGSETAILQRAVQIQQETPADTQIADYYERLKASPKDPNLHLKLGEIYLERGLYELAAVSFQQALGLQAKFPQAHLGLSQIFRKKKLPQLELAEMEAAVAEAPDDPQLRLKLGILCMEPQHFDYKKAKKQFQALKRMESPLAAELGAKMGLD